MRPSRFTFLKTSDVTKARPLSIAEAGQVAGGNFNRAGTYAGHAAQPGFKNPTIISDDGINIHTSDPSTSNVAYDSPFTPIPA